MRSLLATTCVSALVLGLSAPAAAETLISTALTTPVTTGTANDDLRITSAGSVKPTSGAAVTINSSNKVTNEGTIAIQGANGSTGILANTNLTGDIINTGTITIDENYTPTDTDNDGDLDGPFAQGSNRNGILVQAGGTYTGNITNGGTITVEGNSSAAIAVLSPLTGSISSSGTISVVGDNSYGIRAGDVSGNMTLSKGSISVRGANAVGVSVGNVGGAFVLQNSVSSSGYRSTSAPADTSKLDADDLLQGGSAVVIGGNVAGGVLFDAAPRDTNANDPDEDDDGIPDAQETTASVVSYGAAPAVTIGSASQTVTLGSVASSTAGYGLVVKGLIAGGGVYSGVNGNGLVIGGFGQAVTVTNGMSVTGSITGSALNGNAIGLRVGSGASVPVIELGAGATIGADGGGTASTSAQALLIDAGGNVATIRNAGAIIARVNGSEGTAAAIVDKSGTVTLLENRGAIGVSNAAALGDKAVAFDLSANSSGVTVNQLAVTSGTAPSIAGTMLFGSGNDVLNAADGTVAGTAKFGAGNNQLLLSGDAAMTGGAAFGAGNDSVQLGGTSSLIGNLAFGGGSDSLALGGTSIFRGQLSGASGLAVNIGTGTTLDVTNTDQVDIASLTTGANSTIGVTIGSTGHTLYNVLGAADFGSGTKVDVKLLAVGGVAGTYKIVDAATLTGGGNLLATGSLPILFASSLDSTTAPGEVNLVIRTKTADELDLNGSEGSILAAVLGSADKDAAISGALLGAADTGVLQDTLQALLPEHAGGAFETATKGARLLSRLLADPNPPVIEQGGLGIWLQQVGWGTSKSIGSTSSYDLTGWGAGGGVELGLGKLGAIGASLAYLSGRDSHSQNELQSSQYEGGFYWRAGAGPIRGFAKIAASSVNFNGERNFTGTVNGSSVTRTAKGDWKGRTMSATAGASYEFTSGRFNVRPTALIEYYRLKEKGYTETGGGDAFNLIVDDRTSSETAVSGIVTLGYRIFGQPGTDSSSAWGRVELDGGRRQIVSGKLGKTTARFAGGTPFTLTPEDRTSGFLAALRLIGGGAGVTLGAEVNGEEQQGRASIGAKASISLAL